MAEGSPLLAIKRGEKVAMPPAIWIQTKGDLIHDYTDPNSGFNGSEAQRFADMYRRPAAASISNISTRRCTSPTMIRSWRSRSGR